MSKPSWSWRWESLKFWSLGGGAKRRKTSSHKHRSLRMETLDARMVLAADSFVGPLAPLPESIDPQAANPPALTSEAEPTTSEVKPASGEGEAASARNASSAAFLYDVNDDGRVSPIDVLFVINASSELRAGGAISAEAFAAFDLNHDGVLANDDVDLVVHQADINGWATGQESDSNGPGHQPAGRRDDTRGTSRSRVASFRDVASGNFVTLESRTHDLVGVESKALRAEQSRSDLRFGLIAFEVHNVQPGSVVEVTVVLPGDEKVTATRDEKVTATKFDKDA